MKKWWRKLRLWKKILLSIFAVLLLVALWHINLIWYGIQQGMGQMNVLWNTKTPKEFLVESKYSDSLKKHYEYKLKLIKEIKDFAIDSLGLRQTGSYEHVFDQEGKPILWAITACEPYELKAKYWSYGFLGKMPYKGYFDSTKIYNLEKKLSKEGYDTGVFTPAAWSTLGWFNEPILSSMLNWSEGFLASVIIHELTHSTVWIKGNIDFNENMADFVGDKGALMFLAKRFGKDSPEYKGYQQDKIDNDKYYRHMLEGAKQLEKFYGKLKKLNKTLMKKQKHLFIRKIVKNLDTVSFYDKKYFSQAFTKKLPNNTHFMQYRRYQSKQNEFAEECKTKFGNDLRKYLVYLKKKYPTTF